jgi:hypothetical protein
LLISKQKRMVPKMLKVDVMGHLRGTGLLFMCALALSVPASSLALTYTPFGTPAPTAATPIEGFVALSVSDFGGSAAGIVPVSSVLEQADQTSSASLLDTSDDDNDDQAVIRHRGFRKAILIVLICGAIIRFLTSTTFLRFITDALDPKAW